MLMSDSHLRLLALSLSPSLSSSLSLFGHHTRLICPHANFLCVACCKGCRHFNVFHVAVINMLIFLISHLKPAVSFSSTHFLLVLLPQRKDPREDWNKLTNIIYTKKKKKMQSQHPSSVLFYLLNWATWCFWAGVDDGFRFIYSCHALHKTHLIGSAGIPLIPYSQPWPCMCWQ